jgi:type I restriction enzyme S subunit
VLDVLRNGVNCKQDKKGVGDKVSRIESISNADFDINKVGYAILSKSDKDKHRLLKGDILFSHINSPIHVGKTALFSSDEEVYHGVNLLLMRTKSFLSESYFEHYLKFIFKEGYWKGLCKQSVNQASVNQNDIKKVTINFPKSLTQQKQIVATLDKAFAAIDTAKANSEQNLQNAKELFESYLQNVFENKGDDWEEKKWGELCHFVRGPFGGSLKKSMFKESGYVVYEQKHAIHNHFNQLRYFIDEEKFNEMKRFEVKTGDIIMSCSGVTLGRVAIIPDNIPQGIINQALLKLTPNKEVYVEFIKHWLRSNIFQTIIFRHSGGAAIPNVPAAKILKEIIIPIPNIKEQKRVVKKIELTLIQTKKLEAIYTQKIADLEEMKKSVLQKAFSGQLNTIN